MRYIDAIVQKYKMLTMFEMFSSQIFAPGQQSGILRSSSQNNFTSSITFTISNRIELRHTFFCCKAIHVRPLCFSCPSFPKRAFIVQMLYDVV